jgi:hypothetical protein
MRIQPQRVRAMEMHLDYEWDENRSFFVGHKKRRHERYTVRAGRPVTQLTSSMEGGNPCHLINWNIYTIA